MSMSQHIADALPNLAFAHSVCSCRAPSHRFTSSLHFFKDNPVSLWAPSQENFHSLVEVLVMVYWALSDTAHPGIHSTFHPGPGFLLSTIRETVVTIPIS